MPFTLGLGHIWALIKVLGLLLAFGFAFYGGYEYSQNREKAIQADMQQIYENQMQRERERREAISMEYEEKLAQARKQTRTITRRIVKEVEKPIYKECVVPKSGVELLNEAVTKHNQQRNLQTINEIATAKNAQRKVADTPKPNIMRPAVKDNK